MMNEKEITKISKFLSLVLRHKPEEISLKLDANGWADVDELISKCNKAGLNLNFEILKHVVDTNPKKRFAFNENKTRIRANQGHSIEVELGLTPVEPPEFLYHGTADRFAESIIANGLIKQSRQHVHLSVDLETATIVGKRHGRPVIFKVSAKKMFDAGYQFFISENGVWLTDGVPKEFLSL